MRQSERASIMRIVSDLIEADGIIDAREIIFLDSLREKYGIKKEDEVAAPDFDKMCTYKITYPNFQAFSKNKLCKWVTQRLFFVSLHHVCT